MQEKLHELKKDVSHIVAIRGKGLMLAIEISVDPKELIRACAKEGLLLCKTGGPAVRFLPPLNVSLEQIDEGISRLRNAFLHIGEGNGSTSKN